MMTAKFASDQFDILPEEIQQEAIAALENNDLITIRKLDLCNLTGEVWGWAFDVETGLECSNINQSEWESVPNSPLEVALGKKGDLLLRSVNRL